MNEDIDLASLDTSKGADEGFELQLTHPKTGAALPIWITVLGADSQAYQDALNEQRRRYIKAAAKNNKVTLSPEEMQANALELLISSTRTWRGASGSSILLGGEKLAPSPVNFRKIYTGFVWIREQVDAAIADRANFLPGGSMSSSGSPATSSN